MSGAEEERPAEKRPRAAWFVLGAIALAFVALEGVRTPPAYEPVVCGEDLEPDARTVVMLSASWCRYCRRARAFLHDEGIRHCEYDVETTGEGRRRFAALGVKVIPVLQVGEDTLVGFNRSEIMQALIANDLAELDAYGE